MKYKPDAIQYNRNIPKFIGFTQPTTLVRNEAFYIRGLCYKRSDFVDSPGVPTLTLAHVLSELKIVICLIKEDDGILDGCLHETQLEALLSFEPKLTELNLESLPYQALCGEKCYKMSVLLKLFADSGVESKLLSSAFRVWEDFMGIVVADAGMFRILSLREQKLPVVEKLLIESGYQVNFNRSFVVGDKTYTVDILGLLYGEDGDGKITVDVVSESIHDPSLVEEKRDALKTIGIEAYTVVVVEPTNGPLR